MRRNQLTPQAVGRLRHEFFREIRQTAEQGSLCGWVIDAIRKAGEKDEIRYDREEFRLTGEGEGRHICNLENIYREYCGGTPQIRRILMRNFVRWLVCPTKKVFRTPSRT